MRSLLLALVVSSLAASVSAAQEVQWVSTGGPGQASVQELTVPPNDNVFALTLTGVERSENEGRTWNTFKVGGSFNTFALVSPRTSVYEYGHLYLGDHSYRERDDSLRASSVATWALDGYSTAILGAYRGLLGPVGTRIRALSAAPSGHGYAAIGAYACFYPGHRDSTWSYQKLPVRHVTDVRWTGPDRRALAATTSGVFETTNGASWERLGLDGVSLQTIYQTPDSTLLAGTPDGLVYRSADGGANWTKARVTPADAVQTLFASSLDTVWAGTAGSGLFRSLDGGASWSATSVTDTITAIGGHPDGLIYVAVRGDGLRRSDDNGATWTTLRWTDMSVAHLTSGPNRAVFASDRWNYGSSAYVPGDDDWRSLGLPGQNSSIMETQAGPDGALYAMGHDEIDGAFRSTLHRVDQEQSSWNSLHTFASGKHVENIEIGQDGVLLAGSQQSSGQALIYRSADGGATWNVTARIDSADVRALHRAPSGKLYAGIGGASDSAAVLLYRSTDNGQTWQPSPISLDTSLNRPVARVERLASGVDGSLVAITGAGLVRSTDEGQSWRHESVEFNGKLAQGPEGALITETYSYETGHRLHLSRDGGATWTPYGPSIEKDIRSLTLDSEGFAYVGTDRGVYRATRRLPVDVESPSHSSNRFALDSYPNPFRRRATIRYELPRAGKVRVAVYDVLGRRVRTLVDGQRASGRHRAHFEASSLSAGVYLIRARFETSNEARTVTRKVTVAR